MKTAAIILLAALSLGCASTGRFTLLEIDARRPAQMAAMRAESLAPYGYLSNTNDPVQNLSAVPWDIVPEIFKIGARFRIGHFEWDKRPRP